MLWCSAVSIRGNRSGLLALSSEARLPRAQVIQQLATRSSSSPPPQTYSASDSDAMLQPYLSIADPK